MGIKNNYENWTKRSNDTSGSMDFINSFNGRWGNFFDDQNADKLVHII